MWNCWLGFLGFFLDGTGPSHYFNDPVMCVKSFTVSLKAKQHWGGTVLCCHLCYILDFVEVTLYKCTASLFALGFRSVNQMWVCTCKSLSLGFEELQYSTRFHCLPGAKRSHTYGYNIQILLVCKTYYTYCWPWIHSVCHYVHNILYGPDYKIIDLICRFR